MKTKFLFYPYTWMFPTIGFDIKDKEILIVIFCCAIHFTFKQPQP